MIPPVGFAAHPLTRRFEPSPTGCERSPETRARFVCRTADAARAGRLNPALAGEPGALGAQGGRNFVGGSQGQGCVLIQARAIPDDEPLLRHARPGNQGVRARNLNPEGFDVVNTVQACRETSRVSAVRPMRVFRVVWIRWFWPNDRGERAAPTGTVTRTRYPRIAARRGTVKRGGGSSPLTGGRFLHVCPFCACAAILRDHSR